MQYLAFYSQFLSLENPRAKDFTSCACPLHDDRSPSAGVNLQTGVFNCHRCGSFSPSGFLRKIDTTISPQMAALIVNDYRLKNKVISHEENATYTTPWRSPKFEELAERCKETPIVDIPFVQEYAEEHGLTMQTLIDAGLGFLDKQYTHWKRDSLVFVYWLGGRVVGLRYRDEQGNKSYEPGSHGTLWRTDRLEADDAVCIIAEGESDCLRIQQEVPTVKVLAAPGVAFRKEWERELLGISRIILIPQADEASSKLVDAANRTLGDRVKVLNLPWERGQVGKDVCHWLIYNKGEQLAHQVQGLTFDKNYARIMDMDEFKGYAETVGKSEPVIKKLLNRGEIAILGGPPKNMKTWLAINLIRTVFSTDTFCDLPDMYGPQNETEKVLLIEEEGNAEKLYERVGLICGDLDLQNKLFFGHRLGLKLDTEDGFQRVLAAVEKYNITGIVMDPFQRLMNAEEDSATDTAQFWNNIHRLIGMHPQLWLVILHHFTKSATFKDMWNALRGSIRAAGEVDLGIFIEKRPKAEGTGIYAKFDGRNIEPMETPDGKDIFKFYFKAETGRFHYDTAAVNINKHLALWVELRERRTWTVDEAAKHFDVDRKTVLRWVDKLKDKVTKTGFAPVTLELTPSGLTSDIGTPL